MDIKKYFEKLKEANKLIGKKKYAEALQIIEELLKEHKTNTNLLMKKTFLIYLSNECKYKLNDVKNILKLAEKIDPTNVEILLELAHYYLIQNEYEKSLKYFNISIKLCLNILEEAIEWKLKCLDEYKDNIDEVKNEAKKLKRRLNNLIKRALDKAIGFYEK